MTFKVELHKNEAVEETSKIARVKKSTNLVGEGSIISPRVVRIYFTDGDATDSSSDEEDNLPGEKSKQHKRICKEIIIENGKTKVISKRISLKEKKDTKVIHENVKKYRGVILRKWGRWGAQIRDGSNNTQRWLGTFDIAIEAALAYDKATIEIRCVNALTNILKSPPKKINTVKTMPPLRKTNP